MMYDIWESLLLESEIESQVIKIIIKQVVEKKKKCLIIYFSKSLKRVASVMETQVSQPLGHFRTIKSLQLNINKQQRADLEEILRQGQEIVREKQDNYFDIYNKRGVSSEYYFTHNEYLLELCGMNSFYSKYQYNILPHLLQVTRK